MDISTQPKLGASAVPKRESDLRLLVETGLTLASQRNSGLLAQMAVDAGLQLSGATCGIFFYLQTADGSDIHHHQLSTPGDSTPNPFAAIALLAPSLGAPLRIADITANPPFAGVSLALRSFLGVPVISTAGEPLGSMLFGHPQPDIFTAQAEALLTTLAAQAAAALENARLAETLTREIAVADTARAAQRETAGRLEEALHAAQLGTWSWDRATDLLDLDARAAELFFSQPHVPIARSVLRERIVAPEDRPLTTVELRNALDSGGLYKAEYRVQDPAGSGEFRWVSARGKATFRPGSTEITGMIGTIQDITERKLHEATLRQSEKLAATGRLAATIAHEINNPLEAVTNLVYLAKTDPSVPAPVRRLLETADSEIARVAAIAQQTLGFYRDTSRPVEVDLNQLLEGVVDLFSRKLTYKKLTCALDLAPNLRVFGLQGELRQIFSNLLVNAIDASTAGTIHIRGRHCRRRSVSKPCKGVAILIADAGSGIPESIRRSLFSPFFTTKQTLGTGLGLWVTRGILEKIGGSITFRTRTEPPTGSCFRVFLPVEVASKEFFAPPQSTLIQ